MVLSVQRSLTGTYTSRYRSRVTPPAAQTVTVTAGNAAIANVSLTANSGINGMVERYWSPSQPVFYATVTYSGTGANTASGSTTRTSTAITRSLEFYRACTPSQ